MDNNVLKALNVIEQVNNVILGKDKQIREIMAAFLAGGHILLEDIPGVGKTTLATAFSKAMALDCKRVQFTPDVMPSDLTGYSVYRNDLGQFIYQPGSVFCNLLLADEINRATPRTQSALLECMEEHQVTVDGETRKLGFPFIVIATQNPIETAGTYQLPEAQLDRFLLQISMGYPKQNEELEIIKRFMTDSPLESLSAVCNADDVKGMVKEAEGVHVDEAIMNYIVDIADKTRNNINIAIGVSTRGVINMVKAVRAYTYINGRNYVVPEDVYNLAIPVFAHRILLSRGISDSAHREDVMREVIGQCKVPTEDWSK